MPNLHLFAEAIWTADGPSVRLAFVKLPTRMIVVKLGDGRSAARRDWSFTDRGDARKSLARLLSWISDGVTLARGTCVKHDVKRFVQSAFRSLRV